MECNGLFSFLVVIKEAFQILPKNGKLMALVTIFSLLLTEITFAAFGFSIIGLAQDMASAAKSLVPDPSSFDPTSFDPSKLQDQLRHIQQIVAILYAVEIAFILVFLVISFITTMATILVAAVSRVGNTLSIKNLFSRVAGTWKKPFLTSIYAAIQALGLLAVPGIFAVPVFMYPNVVTVLIAVLFAAVVFLIFYLYLMVIWELAIVVSVLEEGCYGMVAMGKASELVKGQRLKGYMLNLSFLLLSLILFAIYQVIYRLKGPSSAIICGLFLVGFSYLVKILQVVAYTVLYFHCKKQHGEMPEIDIGVAKYELLPKTYT
ncbi:uncharacterized protein [Henckelia pumila]|uniref:uncharacterized protein n=1 Tax=Henckelia pumila TaxID=405737 RepID=UPI003C6E0676